MPQGGGRYRMYGCDRLWAHWAPRRDDSRLPGGQLSVTRARPSAVQSSKDLTGCVRTTVGEHQHILTASK